MAQFLVVEVYNELNQLETWMKGDEFKEKFQVSSMRLAEAVELANFKEGRQKYKVSTRIPMNG